MASKSVKTGRSRLSYIIKENSNHAHTAGINALALDATNQILYSAGRDSSINSWQLNLDHILPQYPFLSPVTSSKDDTQVNININNSRESFGKISTNYFRIVPTLNNNDLSSDDSFHSPKSPKNDHNDIFIEESELIPEESISQASEIRLKQQEMETLPSSTSSSSFVVPSAMKVNALRNDATTSSSRRSVSFSLNRPLNLADARYESHMTSVKSAWKMEYTKVVEHNSRFFRKPENKSITKDSGYFRAYTYHTDWVNEIVLTDDGSHLVSCSSDRLVCMWNTSGLNERPICLGHHKDFVKRLALCSASSWVASGGFDRRICLWDVRETRSEKPILTFESSAPEASIYALACNSTGHLVASGSPEKVVSLWDPRVGPNRIAKLQGHTGNIRDLLVSSDGQWIISASSDTTIKLWSIKKPSQCFTTYSHYDDTVLSLYSVDPELNVFWAGGRDGWVSKLSRLYRDDVPGGVFVCKESAPVFDLVAYDNSFLWTATPQASIKRWRDVPISKRDPLKPIQQESYHGSPFLIPRNAVIDTFNDDTGSIASFSTSLYSHRDPIIPGQHRLLDHTNAASENLGSQVVPSSPVSPHVFLDSPSAFSDANEDSLSDQRDAVWPSPDATIPGAPGIVKFVLLNNKRFVVTLNCQGEVDMWDIIRCEKIKSFGKQNFDDILAKENSIEWIANWCTIDCKLGILTVHLEEGKCYDGEIYYEDLGLSISSDNEDQRVNLSRWVLTYLFFWYIRELHPFNKELEDHANVWNEILNASFGTPIHFSTLREVVEKMRKPPESLNESSASETSNSQQSLSTSVTGKLESSVPMNRASVSDPKTKSNSTGSTSLMGKFNPFRKRTLTGGSNNDNTSNAATDTSTALMKRTASTNSKTSQSSNAPKSNAVDSSIPPLPPQSSTSMQSVNGALNSVEGNILLKYDETPPLMIPNEVLLVFSYQESFDVHTFLSVFRSPIRSLSDPAVIKQLEETIPGWVYHWIIQNNPPQRNQSKLSFQLLPHPDSLLPAMPQGNSRLTANRMLRVKKVITYVAERLGLAIDGICLLDPKDLPKASPSSDSSDPMTTTSTVFIEILCNDVILNPRTNLSTVKHFIWKGGGDIPLYYREIARKS